MLKYPSVDEICDVACDVCNVTCDVQNPRGDWKCDVISDFFVALGFLRCFGFGVPRVIAVYPTGRRKPPLRRCKSWVPVLSLRQGTARTSKRIEPRVSRIGR